jgi:enoyl-CoA hydratase/carnithine racemase
MKTPDISVERRDATLHVRLTRAAKRNALTSAMYVGLADALAQAEQDDAIRTVILSGEGESFCAGNDLADFVGSPPSTAEAPVFRFMHALAGASKIVIAAVQGRAVGIGTTMLLHCDFVLVEPDAELRMPFVDLGLVPEAGSSLLVPELLGQLRAAELLLLGEAVPAGRAVEIGLANRIVPKGEALAEAFALAGRLAQKPPGALVATKKLMKSPVRGLAERIEEENGVFAARLRTEEVRALISRFFASRAPPP